MQFFLFDLAATLLFLAGYLTLVTLRQARALPAGSTAQGSRAAHHSG
ncbi:MAG TPA: hypothetical protein VMT09_10020 [Steroidobacteraceae bacterium]|nr:hypothetical protein [Steroidobacteraceae bacterium]